MKPFYENSPSVRGISKAIEKRKQFQTNRALLVQVLEEQYGDRANDAVKKNIRALASENTFTITTAHQNNLFTGPLYFIYKIIHTIKLTQHLNEVLPSNYFVPVFYIGSEDADLAELNHIYLEGEKLEWNTSQTGAVGNMIIDKELVKLISRIEGQLSVLPNGQEILGKLKNYYKEGVKIKEATFYFVNDLFENYGLVILLPDHEKLKAQMLDIFQDDLLNQSASQVVEKTTGLLQSAGYKMQASPREINVFYLKDKIRERIERKEDRWRVVNTAISFTKDELLEELRSFPARFSPNVILRGLYQETILPNLAFIGGGGETAYWLQYKDLFAHYNVPFPVLVLRNSFLIVEKKWKEQIKELGLSVEDFFLPEDDIIKKWVTNRSGVSTRLNGSISELEKLYDLFKQKAATVDSSLGKHVEALKSRTVSRIHELEKKMLRAEKRKYSDQQRRIKKIKSQLFPGNGLQERYENVAYYYAKMGEEFLDLVYQNSLALEQEFTVITLK